MLVKLTDLQTLDKVTPSRYLNLSQCKLRGVLSSLGIPGLLPVSPNAYFGIAAHRLLERASKGMVSNQENLDNTWNLCVAEVDEELASSLLTSHLVPLSTHVKQYELKKRLLLNTAAFLIPSFSGEYNRQLSGNERWIETPDRKVGGYADKIVQTAAGYEIIDYKTGEVIGRNGIKAEYSIQLMLYAGILYECSGEWPAALKIIDVKGNSYTIGFDKNECIQLLSKARILLLEVNEIIAATKSLEEKQQLLATPTPENCRYCSYRPACLQYWNKKKQTPGAQWPHDITGTYTDNIALGNGTHMLRLEFNNIVYKIRGWQLERHQVVPNEKYAIYNLSKDKAENCYSETMLTTLYNC
ncbi:hypothetical protein PAECIP111802_07032 [Paenibacillus allorhizosphaerae]|uniref:PD-(D/E)XK endonuclease-like domain-containing protein n=2 Tax=Paenibacillus allorhizosphaerae TaxID=2849866 RepID=A0ABN7TWB9_9BACL|nr:hypothetical protein PAECIP111802_07032 [Paenibacillus allorhizosphaerae]